MSRLSSLPDEVLKLVMQHVPVWDRLGNCCSVSKRMHAAAVATTQELTLLSPTSADPHEHARSALGWISKYGQQLTRLAFDETQPVDSLPCLDLLELSDCDITLGEAAGCQSGLIHQCTKLTRLELRCIIMDAPAGAVLDSLSTLVHLQHLEVDPRVFEHRYTLAGLSGATLPRLQHLTYLKVHGLSYENLSQLGALTNLQTLWLWDGAAAGAVVGTVAIGPSSVPGLALPASLKTLLLFAPVEAGLLSCAPAGLQDLRIACGVEGPAEGPGSFLSCMAGLQHLTLLEISILVAWPPPCPAYSALTASSSLVRLDIPRTCSEGVWQSVFPAARRLTDLTYLRLGDPYPFDEDGDLAAFPPAWGEADLSSLVSCCPSLCEVECLHLQFGLHGSELLKLTALTRLQVCLGPDVAGFAFSASLRGLAAVTQLRWLHIMQDSQVVNYTPLLSLTRLTGLRAIRVDSSTSRGPDFEVYSSPMDGSAPDVWPQLLQRCAAEPDCHPSALRSLAQQLAEQQALTAQLQQQVSDQEQGAAAQQQLVAAQQQQISALQGQLLELRSAVQQLLPSRQAA